ncbi:MAG: response regulator transcription factor [Ruminococcaceae bacterium]|nr:response regulator transcription factor [Oscillospiraceae bacterium]
MIYLVEDDENIRELVTYALKSMGLEAESFETPSLFWTAMSKNLPSLVLLDIMLPEEDGLTILKKLKRTQGTSTIPVIMLSAKSSEIDKVNGFELGADDYIAKPFGVMELVARVKARLRDGKEEKRFEYNVGPLYVCPEKHIVTVNGVGVNLTYKEFEILCMLLKNMDIVLTRDQLLNTIWGYSFDGESRTVDVHIRTLRQKLGVAGELIETVRGIGYKIGK